MGAVATAAAAATATTLLSLPSATLLSLLSLCLFSLLSSLFSLLSSLYSLLSALIYIARKSKPIYTAYSRISCIMHKLHKYNEGGITPMSYVLCGIYQCMYIVGNVSCGSVEVYVQWNGSCMLYALCSMLYALCSIKK
jgi:hypothetical protein